MCISWKIFKKGATNILLTKALKFKNISRTIWVKWPFSSTFPVSKKNSEQFQRIQGIPQSRPQFKCNMMNEIIHVLENLSMNWVKYFFNHGKWNFEPIRNFAHTNRISDLAKGPANTLPPYLEMLIMKISTQVKNHKYSEKVLELKTLLFKRMGLKFRNPKFNILGKKAFFFFVKCWPFGVKTQ